jgi:hypothetical protein
VTALIVLLVRYKDLVKSGIMVVSLFVLNCIASWFSCRIHHKLSVTQNLKDHKEKWTVGVMVHIMDGRTTV